MVALTHLPEVNGAFGVLGVLVKVPKDQPFMSGFFGATEMSLLLQA